MGKDGLRTVPLEVGREEAIRSSQDIASTSVVFERLETRLKIAGTDVGRSFRSRSTTSCPCWTPTAAAPSRRITGNIDGRPALW